MLILYKGRTYSRYAPVMLFNLGKKAAKSEPAPAPAKPAANNFFKAAITVSVT